MYCFHFNILSITFTHYFTPGFIIHDQNTRQVHAYRSEAAHLKIKLFSIRCYGPHLWNKLPGERIKLPTVGLFKSNLKNFLLDKGINHWTLRFFFYKIIYYCFYKMCSWCLWWLRWLWCAYAKHWTLSGFVPRSTLQVKNLSLFILFILVSFLCFSTFLITYLIFPLLNSHYYCISQITTILIQ